MATHPSVLAWEIPWTEETGGLQSRGLQRVRHDGLTEHTRTHIHAQMLKQAVLQVYKHLKFAYGSRCQRGCSLQVITK